MYQLRGDHDPSKIQVSRSPADRILFRADFSLSQEIAFLFIVKFRAPWTVDPLRRPRNRRLVFRRA